MNSWIHFLNGFSNTWTSAMFRASWQGGIALIAAGAFSEAIARSSGQIQSWLWRGAFLKCLACLLIAAPLAIPLLAPPSPAPASTGTGDKPFAEGTPLGIRSTPASPTAAQPTSALQPQPLPPPLSIIPEHLTTQTLLMAAWFIGLLAVSIRTALSLHRTATLRRTGQRLLDPAIRQLCLNLAHDLHIEPPPALLATDSITSPLLVGIRHPAILLPTALTLTPDPLQLKMILAHELAHLRRRDLAWNVLPTLAGILFYFHPLIWWSRRRCRLAQELACDQIALQATTVPPSTYGQLLIDMLPRLTPRPHFAGVGVSESATHLRRRLAAMKSPTRWTRRRITTAALIAATTALPAILPWKPTARAAAPAASDSAAPGWSEAYDALERQKPGESVTLSFAPAPSTMPNTAPKVVSLTALPAAAPPADPAAPATGPEAKRPPASRGGDPSQNPVTAAATRNLKAVGKIFAATVDILMPRDGTIESVNVKDGQHVKAGDPLFELDVREQKFKVTQDMERLNAAQTKANVEKQKRDNGIGALTDFQNAQTELENEKAALTADSERLDSERAIPAPFDGTVTTCDILPGTYSQRGTRLTTLVNTTDLKIEFQLPDSIAAALGQKLSITLAGKTYSGEVTYIAPNVEEQSQTYIVRGKITGDPGTLKSGMIVNVTVVNPP